MKHTIRYSVIINNRDIVSSICINELELLLSKAELVQDRQMIESMLCSTKRQINNGIPMKLMRINNIMTNCKYCNSCSTYCCN